MQDDGPSSAGPSDPSAGPPPADPAPAALAAAPASEPRPPKRKRGDLDLARAKDLAKKYKHVHVNSRDMKFQATVRKRDDGARETLTFDLTEADFDKAVAASQTYREEREAEERRKADRTEEERREENLAKYGGNCDLERNFVLSLESVFDAVPDIDYLVLNDSTRADTAFKLASDDRYMGVQNKVTAGNRRGSDPMKYGNCNGYVIPILCWNDGNNRGVFLDGRLADRETDAAANLNFTFETVQQRPSFLCLVDRTTIVDTVRSLLSRPGLAERRSETFLRWDLKSKNNVIEMIGATYVIKKFGCRFPTAQNSHVDLVDPDGGGRQLKTACELERKGLHFSLQTNVGRDEGGKRVVGAYPLHADGCPPFFMLDPIHIRHGVLHHWSLPIVFLLLGTEEAEYEDKHGNTFTRPFECVFSRDGEGGCMTGCVYFPDNRGMTYRGDKNRSWAFKETYYQGSAPLSSFLSEELISEMPAATQTIVRRLMAT